MPVGQKNYVWKYTPGKAPDEVSERADTENGDARVTLCLFDTRQTSKTCVEYKDRALRKDRARDTGRDMIEEVWDSP